MIEAAIRRKLFRFSLVFCQFT